MTTTAHVWGPGEIVGGHRLLRRLGAGRSAEVWLAAPAAVEDAERVAVKLVAPGEGADRATREAEALWRARGPHVVRLRDVVPVAAAAPFLLLDAVPHELSTVLASGLSPGAAVTVLVPIARELRRLHRLGVTHGGVRLAAVGLDHRGSPVLLGFGAAVIGPVSAERRTADCAAFAALALVVLAAVSIRGEAWQRLAAWLGASDPAAVDWLTAFVDRCYDLAEPEPVALVSAEPLSAVMLAAAATPTPVATSRSVERLDPRARMRGVADRLAARLRVPWRPPARPEGDASVALDAPRRGTPAAGGRSDGAPTARRGPGRVRPRFWVPAAIAAAGLLAVLVAPAAEVASAESASTEVANTEVATPSPTASGSPAVTRSATADGAARDVAAPLPLRTGTVVDEIGGAVVVAVDGPRGPEQVVLVAGPGGWEVREQFAVDAPVVDASPPDITSTDAPVAEPEPLDVGPWPAQP